MMPLAEMVAALVAALPVGSSAITMNASADLGMPDGARQRRIIAMPRDVNASGQIFGS